MSNFNRQPNFLVRFFTRDIIRKLIALFFALLLYYTVSSRIGSETRLSNVPVEIDMPPGLVLLDDRVPTVTLTVRGSKRVLERLDSAGLRGRARVLAANYTPQSAYALRLNPGNFDTGVNLSVTAIEPSELLLNIEEVATARVGIEPRYDSLDKLPEDYAVSGVKFNPSEIQIAGPKSVVSRVRSISTRPIPLDAGSIYSFDYNAELNVPAGVVASPAKVVAAIGIEHSRVERTFDSIPVSVLQGSGKAAKVELLTAPNVEVKVSGPNGVVAALKPSRIHAYCDVSNLKDSGSYTVDVSCYIDRGENLRIISVYPDKVKIKLTL